MANTLPHDQDGFLMGEGGRPLSQAATAMLSSLSGIRSATMSTARGVEALGRQMALLRQAMESRASQPPASKPRQAAPQNAATPAGTPTRRDATPRLPTPPSQPAGTQPARQDTSSAPTPPSQPAVAQRERSAAKAAQASNQARGKDGRFSGKSDSGHGKEAADAHSTAQAKDDPSAASPLTSAANRMTDAAKAMTQEAASGADQVDPTVQAMKEVAAPVARGWQAWGEFRGNGNKDKAQEGLLKRILARMGAMKKSTDKASTDASKASAQTNKHLENLENKPTGGGESGGFFGGLLAAIAAIVPMILALLTKIPVIGPLLAMGGKLVSGVGGALAGAGAGVLKKIPVLGKMMGGGAAAGAAGTAAAEAGAAGRAGGIGSKLLGAGGKVLRKIPLIGGLIAALGTASEVSDIEGNDQLSRKEKDQRSGKAVGGFGGMLAGGAAGAKIGALAGAAFGPLGAAIGGALGGAVGMFLGDQAGQIIGDKMGEWTNDLRNADIAGAITGAWDSVVSGFKSAYESIGKTWGGFVDSAKAGWDTIANLFKSAYEGLKSIPVIGPAIQAVEDAAKKTAAVASAATETAKAKAVEVGAKAVEKGKEVAQATKEKAVEVGTKAAVVGGKAVDAGKTAVDNTVQAAKEGGKWVAENTTPGKVAVAAGGAVGGAVNYGADVASDVARSAKAKLTGKASERKSALLGQMSAAGITDQTEQAMFMAQMHHESSGFTKMEEGFNYRSADRLMQVSKSARKLGKPALEEAMAKGPEAVAEAMYGGRMGNTEKGDAYKFRGRGYIQLTGKGMYKEAGDAIGVDLANNPDLAASPEVAAKVATWYWQKQKRAGDTAGSAARRGDVRKTTQIINGGLNGLEDRERLFGAYKTEIASARDGGAQQKQNASSVPPSPRMPSPVVATPTVSTPPAPPRPPQMASTAAVPDTKVEPPAPVAVAASGGGASGVAAQGVSQHLSNPTIAHIVTGGIGFRG